MSEVQKDLEDISAGIGQFFKNRIYKNFVRILTSKLARSTLTRLVELGLTVKYFMPIKTDAVCVHMYEGRLHRESGAE
jgi:hypothetical protein